LVPAFNSVLLKNVTLSDLWSGDGKSDPLSHTVPLIQSDSVERCGNLAVIVYL